MALSIVSDAINLDWSENSHIFEHGLNTEDIVAQVWQHGSLIHPTIRIVDKDSVEIIEAGALQNARIVIMGNAPAKSRKKNNVGEDSA